MSRKATTASRGYQRRGLLSLWEKTGKKGSWAHSSRQPSQESYIHPLPLPSGKHQHPYHLALRRAKPSNTATVSKPGNPECKMVLYIQSFPGDLSWEDNPRWPPSSEHTQSWDAEHAKGQWKGYFQLVPKLLFWPFPVCDISTLKLPDTYIPA